MNAMSFNSSRTLMASLSAFSIMELNGHIESLEVGCECLLEILDLLGLDLVLIWM